MMSEFQLQVAMVAFSVYILAVLWMVWTQPRGAPWVPTPMRKARKMLEMAEVKPGEVVYDLGSGDGRVLVAAARRYGARAVGIELDLLRCLWARLLIRVLGLHQQAQVIWGDFYPIDIGEADVVFLYLRQKTNVLLMAKLLVELRPGTRVVSNTFTFPGWEIVRQDKQEKIYLYKVGMRGLEDFLGKS